MAMVTEEFIRLNVLSERLLCEKATSIELIEFAVLFDEWNISDDLNSFNDFFYLE